jgi:hypothetical protein
MQDFLPQTNKGIFQCQIMIFLPQLRRQTENEGSIFYLQFIPFC